MMVALEYGSYVAVCCPRESGLSIFMVLEALRGSSQLQREYLCFYFVHLPTKSVCVSKYLRIFSEKRLHLPEP